MSTRVNLSPEFTTLYTKHSAKKVGGNKKRLILKTWAFRLPKVSRFPPSRFLRYIKAKVVKAQHFASCRTRCSRKVSSSCLTRLRSYVEPVDLHRAEAVEDCIEFMNSSCTSLKRWNLFMSYCWKTKLYWDSGCKMKVSRDIFIILFRLSGMGVLISTVSPRYFTDWKCLDLKLKGTMQFYLLLLLVFCRCVELISV